jgi:hypothetical protein
LIQSTTTKRLLLISLVFALFAIISNVSSAETIRSSQTGLAVSVSGDGSYTVSATHPSWSFAGTVGSPANAISSASGTDKVGAYRSLAFTVQAGNVSEAIRLYDDQPVVLFTYTCKNETPTANVVFPSFTTIPAALHTMSYRDTVFSPHAFSLQQTSTPWVFFDSDSNAAIISPASNFMISRMITSADVPVQSALNTAIATVPAGFSHSTLLAVAPGINHTFDIWGDALVKLQGKTPPSNQADTSLKYLGYWTDNGADYYYNYDQTKGYTGTLSALADYYKKNDIPIHYMQLDSWWYYKSLDDPSGHPGKPKNAALPEGEWNRYGGLLEYRAHTALFPNGLKAFQSEIGLPLITHNRWIDANSPYHQKYHIEGVAAVDINWWEDIAAYLQQSGVVTYEQDWLNELYSHSPTLGGTITSGDTFMDSMSKACADHGITMQYCMGTPRCFLEGSAFNNLTTLRTSGDRFEPAKWNDFLYTSRLAESIGSWPWADVFKSHETGNLLLANLSAGPVGTGDAIGKESKDNLTKVVRADGVIVKPDVPLVPIDKTYVADASKADTPLVAATYTHSDNVKTAYVFTSTRRGQTAQPAQVSATDVGLDGPVYFYDYFAGTGQDVAQGKSYMVTPGTEGWAFVIAAPIGKSGIAFLGDPDRFVGTGRQRINMLSETAGKLTARVLFADGEKSVVLKAYATAQPKATATQGSVKDAKYDPATHLFTVTVSPLASQKPSKVAGDDVKIVTVQLTLK